jgi:hypothetical protein
VPFSARLVTRGIDAGECRRTPGRPPDAVSRDATGVVPDVVKTSRVIATASHLVKMDPTCCER